MKYRRITKALAAAVFCFTASGFASAQSLPVPPCAGTAVPAAAAIEESLNQLVWIEDELPDDWTPPACTGWTAGPTKVLLAAAGRFELAGDSAALIERLGRISTMTDIVYWSTSRSRWRNLFEEAAALSSPDEDSARRDFSAAEIIPGTPLYYWLKEDNPTAGVVYRIDIHENSPDRLVFETTNATPVRTQLLLVRARIAAAGEFRQLYYIEREAGDSWHYYNLSRLGEATSLAGTSAANYRNRSEAFFRFLSGQQMDREPPAAP
jgi:hypothetical protein